MKKNKLLVLFSILACFCLAFAKAQYQNATPQELSDHLAQLQAKKNDPNQRLKIGIVLSGGGAKGLAHIGTLKVIDSLGIKVDYIAGTSMGAIVGSLYASGYTGKQLDSIFNTINFDDIISDDIPRNAKTFYERLSKERYAVTLPIKKFKAQLPSSLSKGQNIYDLLSRLLSHVKEVKDFRELPIPFLCVATDITTGEEVVLESGYLPRAVNASGALPSLFAPVKIEDRLLIDGGVTDNYPIDKLRERGIDIIIGVDVQDDLKSLDELNSALDILSQINNFRTINAMKVKAPQTDVYIMPDISKYSVVSFDKGRKIINEGAIAARKNAAQLSLLSTPGYQKPAIKNKDQDSIYLNEIRVSGIKNYTRSFVLGRFKLKTPGMVSYKDLSNGINNLQATDNFKKINYKIISEKEKTVFEIEVEESEINNYLKFGLHYDDLMRSAVLINLSSKNLLFNSDIISADIIVGDNLRYNLDYYIDKGRYWSIGLHSEYIGFEKSVSASFVEQVANIGPLGVNSLALKYSNWTQQFFLQTQIDRSINLRIGAELKTLDIDTETLVTENPLDNITKFSEGTMGGIYGKMLLDTYDNAFLPSSGWRVEGDFNLYLFNSEFGEQFNQFSIAQIQAGHAHSFGNLTLRGIAHVGITIGDTNNSAMEFFLGGYGSRKIDNIVPFYGYDFISFGGNSMAKLLLEVDYEIFKKNHLTFGANIAGAQDNLFNQVEWINRLTRTGYAIGYGMETFLGPIEVKYSFSPQQSNSQLFVNFGFKF